jgi:hypothetical protein
MWIIAGLSNSQLGILPLAGLVFLFLSLWSVYDAGYRDNDVCALQLEDDPVLNSKSLDFQDRWFELKTWISATFWGTGGVLLVGGWNRPHYFLIWVVTLIALRATYWLYNRIDKDSRIWLYLPLQGFRFAAYVGLVAIGPVGWAICLAMIIPAWMDYVTYRYGRAFGIKGYPATPTRTYRLVLLCMFLAAITMMDGTAAVWTVATPVALAWFGFLAFRFDWHNLYARAHRLDRRGRHAGEVEGRESAEADKESVHQTSLPHLVADRRSKAC